MALERELEVPPGAVIVTLVARNNRAAYINRQSMKLLRGRRYMYHAHDPPKPPHTPSLYDRDEQDGEIPVESELVLTLGAHVTLVRNMDTSAGLVNGTPGHVVGFHRAGMGPDGLPRWQDLNALSDNPELIIPTAGAAVPVAINPSHVGDPNTLHSYFKTSNRNAEPLWPVVDFTTVHGIQRILVTPVLFEAKDSRGNVIDMRIQVSKIVRVAFHGVVTVDRAYQLPLILAWAISIHKAQGQTIPYVVAELDGLFTAGTYLSLLSFPSCFVPSDFPPDAPQDKATSRYHASLIASACK